MRSNGYIKLSLDEILHILEERGGNLNFMFARQIAPYNIETILALLRIKNIIDAYPGKVKEVIVDFLQWGEDKFSLNNIEKGIFAEPQILDSNGLRYYIAVQPKSKLREEKDIKIKNIYLDTTEIRKMIEKTGLKYMEKSLNHLIDKGKAEYSRVNILDFWGLTTLYYISEISSYIFRISNYEIEEFEDEIRLINGSKYHIYGYKLEFEYKGVKLRFRIYDISHIHEKEIERYGSKKNGYIVLSLYSGSGYILFEEDLEKSSAAEKIIEFSRKAEERTRYGILLFELSEEKLIKNGIIDKKDYVKFIGKNYDVIINTIMKNI
ncbi:MAG: hypothetical protein ACO2ON_02785 [Candidatus Nanopusillus sp.]